MRVNRIGIAILLAASLSFVAFTIVYLSFHWGNLFAYRYELWYFPPPVPYYNMLTSSGMLLSVILPIVAFVMLLVTPAILQIASPNRGLSGSRQSRTMTGLSKLGRNPNVSPKSLLNTAPPTKSDTTTVRAAPVINDNIS